MEKTKKNGFWKKLLALWLNALLIFMILKLFFYLCLALPLYLYFPFEFTFLVILTAYLIICRVFKRKTAGKYLLDINTPKFLANTIKFGAIISLIIFFVYPRVNIVHLHNEAKKMELTTTVTHSFENRDQNLLTDISSLSNQDYAALSSWIEDNRTTAEDYVIQIAKNQKITLIGEVHDVKTYLDFFNEIIPNLYYKAGVRCIAMECIPYTMNRKIEKLINSNDFDEKLCLEISRNQGWFFWGSEGYWNVLKTAWKLNKSLKPDEQKIRVVGIDSDWRGPNFALVFSGEKDGVKNVPFVEKFRRFSATQDKIKVNLREEIMARNIEKEAIEKNDKCVVLVGSNHSFTNYGQGVFDDKGNLIRYNNRMGILLSQKYKNDIFQIVLHHDGCISDEVLNKVIFEKGLAPVGFTVENSPFAMLRDSTQYLYANLPTVSFSDIAQGYIYILPFDKTERCNWIPNYISKEMFMRYKPFYEGRLGRKLKNNEELNALIRNWSE